MSDTLIQKLIERASAKEAEIGSIESYSNKTNLSFPLSEDARASDRLNLNIVNDVDHFIKVMSILLAHKQYFEQACKELELKSTFKWGGFTYNQWLHDIKNRIGVLNLRKKKAELSEIKTRLNELMSPEMKRELELKELEKKLMSEE